MASGCRYASAWHPLSPHAERFVLQSKVHRGKRAFSSSNTTLITFAGHYSFTQQSTQTLPAQM
eukprot:148187-Pleurochrysis_carterae.AAC.1